MEELKTFYANHEAFVDKFEKEKDKYDPIEYQPKPNASNDFGIELKPVIPSEGEIRYIGNRNTQCRYYLQGLEICKHEILKEGGTNFLPCKETLDATYRCFTQNKYGDSILNAPKYTQPYVKKFMDCFCDPVHAVEHCLHPFTSVIRGIYRSKDSKLCDYY